MRKLILAIPVLLAFAGCSAQKDYVDADFKTYQAVSSDWLTRVDADQKLTADEKALRHHVAETWLLRITKNGGGK